MQLKTAQMAMLVVLVAILVGALLAALRLENAQSQVAIDGLLGFISSVVTGILLLSKTNGGSGSP